MGPNDMHHRVVRELADGVVKSLVTGKRETSLPFLKRVVRKTRGATEL